MAIRILKTDTEDINAAIESVCEMIYDIEDLLERGPKQLEAYTSLLKILKAMKRGCPLEEVVHQHAVQGCPPGISPNPDCEHVTCQSCWKEYIQTYIHKTEEGNNA